MPDVPFPKVEEEPEPRLVALRNRLEDKAKVALTGQSEPRSIRRPLLFVLAALGILVALTVDGPVGLAVGGVGLIALLLLAMTDQVVEL